MKRCLLQYLAGGVAAARDAFDVKTGRFLASNGGWAVTNQDRIFPLALLYVEPGTKHCGNRRVLELCLRGGDALRDWQQPDGSFEFIKVDGSRWGNTYMPWSIYHWVEAYALLREHMDAQRRRRWEKGLTLAYEGLARECATPRGHNIPTWNGMSLVRGGQVFDRPDWAAAGRRQVRFSARQQHPHGFWPEGAGPTVGYNTVYVHSLGLYYAFTGDEAVLAPLRRAAEFHATFTYPDGTPIETVDGRQKYHAGPITTGWPGFALSPKGRRLVRLWFDELHKGGGGLVPHLASAWQHAATGPDEPLPAEKDGRIVYRRSALVRRQGPWLLCVSGYVPPIESRPGISRNRWIMARANCLSVWHDKLGHLIGGGNSKHDPFCATFEVWDGGALRLEPDKVTFSCHAGCETIRFHYGRAVGLLGLKPVGPRGLKLSFGMSGAATQGVSVCASFTMRLAAGSTLSSRGRTQELDPMRTAWFSWGPGDRPSRRIVRGNGWSLHMPAGSSLSYPTYPFNPYAIDGASPPEHALATVSIPLTAGRKRDFVLNVR